MNPVKSGSPASFPLQAHSDPKAETCSQPAIKPVEAKPFFLKGSAAPGRELNSFKSGVQIKLDESREELLEEYSPEALVSMLCRYNQATEPDKIRKYLESFPEELLPDICPLIADKGVSRIKKLISDHGIEIIREKLVKAFADKIMMTASALGLSPTIDSGVGKMLPNDTPVNLIWIGSLLPEKYFDGIITIASLSTDSEAGAHPVEKREIVLWKDRSLLSEADDDLMKRIPEHPRMKGINIKVVDINDAGLESVIRGREKAYQTVLGWARDELENYAAVSDILRFALLAKGSAAIDCAEGKVTGRTGRGMIYMDCDALNYELIKRLRKKGEKASWKKCEIELGFAYGEADFLACNEAGHPIALTTLNQQITNLSDADTQAELISLKEDHFNKPGSVACDYLGKVVETTGPGCFYNSVAMLITEENTESLESLLGDSSIIHFLFQRLDVGIGGDTLRQFDSDNTWLRSRSETTYNTHWPEDLSRVPEIPVKGTTLLTTSVDSKKTGGFSNEKPPFLKLT